MIKLRAIALWEDKGALWEETGDRTSFAPKLL